MRYRLILLVLTSVGLLSGRQSARAQQAPARILIVSPLVGEVIDAKEKMRYGLFPAYAADDFREARFVQFTSPNSILSTITLQVTLRNGDAQARPYTRREFEEVGQQIDNREQELQRYQGQVQRATATDSLGATYAVELISGASFIGVLVAQRERELDFTALDLGRITVQKESIRRLELLSATQRQRGWEPIGNGTRLFIAPTARNLRKGEGYVQDIDVLLVGINYGISDNVSVGLLAPIPIGGVNFNIFALTPKVSFKVNEQLHIGGGVLYAFADGDNGGVAYGLATYGSADNNVTLGLGYGVSNFSVSSSPVVVLGGMTRISRRFSLLNESYVSGDYLAGLAGVRVSAARLSGSLGLLYATDFSGGSTIRFIPAFLEFSYRFGRVQ